jgi:hypothetical protein
MTAIGRVLIVAGGLLGAAGAGAAVIPFTTTFDLQSMTDVFGTDPVDNDQVSSQLSLPRFDATLGTLQSVSLDFESTWFLRMQANASDTNSEVEFGFPPFRVNDAHQTTEAISLLQVRLNDPASATRTFFTPLIEASCSDTSTGSLIEFLTAGCRANNTSSGFFSGSLLGPALSSFIGTDPLDLFVGMSSTATMVDCDDDDDDGGDRCSSDSSTSWEGSVRVAYSYLPFEEPPGNGGSDPGHGGDPTPVSEPDTLPLLAAALLLMGLGAARRARNGAAI